MDELVQYDWPGNVRELENVIERAMILSPGSTLVLSESLAPPAGTRSRNAAARPDRSSASLAADRPGAHRGRPGRMRLEDQRRRQRRRTPGAEAQHPAVPHEEAGHPAPAQAAVGEG